MKIPKDWKDVGNGWFDGPGGAQVRILVSTLYDCKTVRGYTIHVGGPMRATKEEAERDAGRVIWSLEAPPDREALARHLGDTVVSFYARMGEERDHPFHGPEDVRQLYRALADTAILLVRTQAEPITRKDLSLTLYYAYRNHLRPPLFDFESGAWLAVADEAARRLGTADQKHAEGLNQERIEKAEQSASMAKALAARLEKLLDRVRASVEYEGSDGENGDNLIEHLDGIMARLEMAERMVLDASPKGAGGPPDGWPTGWAHVRGIGRVAPFTLNQQAVNVPDSEDGRHAAWCLAGKRIGADRIAPDQDEGGWPAGWEEDDFGDRVLKSVPVNPPRVPATAQGRLAARILSGQQVKTEDAKELRFQLSETRRHLAEAQKDRDEWKRTAKKIDADLTFTISIRDRLLKAAGYIGTDLEDGICHVEWLRKEKDSAGNVLDEIGVGSANRLADRVRHLESLRKSCEVGTKAAIAQRNDFERRFEERSRAYHALHKERDLLQKERDLAHIEARAAVVGRDLVAEMRQRDVTVRDELIADYEARIGVLETRNRQKAAALALMARELAEALGAKKVTS